MLRLALLFSAVAVAFDAVAAAIARAFAFNYGQFALLAVILFAAYGIIAGQRLRWPRALVAVAIAVTADATIGTFVASHVGAWIAPNQAGREAIGSTVMTAALCFVVAALGVAVGGRVARHA
ncbi:MAG: hypothetical protein WCD38_06810 [Candidatus Tumulicola sp.]